MERKHKRYNPVYISLFILLGVFQTVNGQRNENAIDSLNDYIFKTISSKPPIIEFYLFIGNKKVKVRKVNAYLNDQSFKKIKRKKVLIDTLKFKKNDSLSFSLFYDNFQITTNKISYRIFLHGGKVIFGRLNNYAGEKSEYLSDNGATYLWKNRYNYQYEIMRNSILNNLTIKRSVLYSIILSNSSGKTQIKIEPEIN